jgi:4'-phosphopantetheinyl transferase EntD
MMAPGWLTRSLADVPAADDWLSPRERGVLADLDAPRRRADWRLGRWAAKAALLAWGGAALRKVEIVASADGAPEAQLGGELVPAALSLSHRNGRALAVVADPELAVGCDLEAVEARSGAFVRTWLMPSERASLESADESGRARLANLIWAAKESAAKARREGLRLDVGRAAVALDWRPSPDGEWRPLTVRWDPEEDTTHGWWREETGWLFAFVSEPASPPPVRLKG